MEEQEQKIHSVAVMLAAAYWRGRLEPIRATVHEQSAVEAMVKAASEADAEHWKSAARVALSL